MFEDFHDLFRYQFWHWFSITIGIDFGSMLAPLWYQIRRPTGRACRSFLLSFFPSFFFLWNPDFQTSAPQGGGLPPPLPPPGYRPGDCHLHPVSILHVQKIFKIRRPLRGSGRVDPLFLSSFLLNLSYLWPQRGGLPPPYPPPGYQAGRFRFTSDLLRTNFFRCQFPHRFL